MHKNQPLPDQNLITNENRFKSKLIEKPCSEQCYSLHRLSVDSLNETTNTRNKRILETNEEEYARKRTFNSPSISETRISMNNSLNDSKNSRSNKNSLESSPVTTLKSSQLLENSWNFSEETLYRALKKIYDYNSCALARFIRTKTCLQIREHIKKVTINYNILLTGVVLFPSLF